MKCPWFLTTRHCAKEWKHIVWRTSCCCLQFLCTLNMIDRICRGSTFAWKFRFLFAQCNRLAHFLTKSMCKINIIRGKDDCNLFPGVVFRSENRILQKFLKIFKIQKNFFSRTNSNNASKLCGAKNCAFLIFGGKFGPSKPKSL